MAKYTSLYLQKQVQRLIGDRDGTLIKPDLMLDFFNDAIDFAHSELIGMHKEGIVDLYWPWKLLKYELFSYKNTITLPANYLSWIELRVYDTEWIIEIVPYKSIDDTLDTGHTITATGPFLMGEHGAVNSSGAIFASNVESPLPDSANSGLDNLEVRGHFSGSANSDYIVEMDGAATFKWSDNGGSSYTSLVAITGDWQDLSNDVQVKLETLTGYTATDKWTFTAYVDREVHILKLNFNPDSDIQFTYAKILTLIEDIGEGVYIPFERFYGAIKLFVQLMSMSWNEENIDIDAFVYRPVIKKLREVGVKNNVGERTNVEPDKTYDSYV